MVKVKRKTKNPRVFTKAEGRKVFNYHARKYMNMSGDEFIKKWKAGNFSGSVDRANVIQLVALLPLVR